MRKRLFSVMLCLCLAVGVLSGCGDVDDKPVSGSAVESSESDEEESTNIRSTVDRVTLESTPYLTVPIEEPISPPEPTEEPKQEFYTVTPEDMLKNVQSLANLVVQCSDKMYMDYTRSTFEVLEEVSADVISPLVGLGTTNSAIHVSEDLYEPYMDDFIEFFLNPYYRNVTITGITFEVLDSNINGSFVYRPETDAVVTIVCEAKYNGTGNGSGHSGSQRFKIDFVVNRNDPTDWLIYNIDPKYLHSDDDYKFLIKKQLRNEDGSSSQIEVGTQIDGGDFYGLNWVVTDAGELIISGHLEDANAYNEVGFDERPWYTYHETITQVYLSCTGLQSMAGMFYGCSSLTSIDLSDLDTSSVTDMSYMFSGCSSLTIVNLGGLDTSRVTDISYMFLDCSSLTIVNLGDLDTSSVTSMRMMFRDCTSLTEVRIKALHTFRIMLDDEDNALYFKGRDRLEVYIVEEGYHYTF